jgi:DNA mismatch repair protein MutS
MFEQYHALKQQQPGAILFFRMGDFYEMFFEDAEIASRELDLTLTARNKQDPNPVPMAGVPHHASQGYIERLVDAGYRVAIAEQIEDPRKAKGLVKRAVVRVVTPGVVLDPTRLESRSPCWLVAVAARGKRHALAFLDCSTGALRCTTVQSLEAAVNELQRMEPKEALLGPGVDAETLAATLVNVPIGTLASAVWRNDEAKRTICTTLGIGEPRGIGLEPTDPALSAVGAVLRYAGDQLGSGLGNVHQMQRYDVDGFMVIDHTTRRNLELTRTLIGNRRKGSLLGLVDRASTAAGSRLLADWMVFPLLDTAAIEARQRAVGALVQRPGLRDQVVAALREVADIRRIGARVAQGTAHARDLSGLRASLAAAPLVARCLADVPELAAQLPSDLCVDLQADLDRWLVDEPPPLITEGGLLRPEAHDELAELSRLSFEGVSIIAKLEAEERERVSIQTLRIRKNRVFGYFIEVTKAHVHKVPDRYLRKQTLTGCERYITPELKELEEKVLGADERRKSLEYELFVALRGRMGEGSERLRALAIGLATIDVLAALAECAVRHDWVRPTLDTSTSLDIVGGRHPVVEASMQEARFVPNDVSLDTDERQLIVLTGPNMSGKSTTMRQVALICLLAQIGSFVPAQSARIGVCDRIFTRVGAADDLASGQSTFMVEMAETAAILHHASHRSLVILDEIGRGTSTFDGLSIAWAVAEDLVDRIGCRALFATHYHELCDLAETRAGVINQSVAVSEDGEQIIFLRRLKDGGASRSYGIQCARLAGLPKHVIKRATRLLKRFEKHAPRNEREQMSLFGHAGTPEVDETEPEAPAPDPVRTHLSILDPDSLSPREALDQLYILRDLLRQGDS